MSKKKKYHFWKPGNTTLKNIDELKKAGSSYRKLGVMCAVDHNTVRRHLIKYRERNSFWFRIWRFFHR